MGENNFVLEGKSFNQFLRENLWSAIYWDLSILSI